MEQISENNKIKSIGEKYKGFFHKFIHFFGWWFGFMGLYSSSAVCPFCGQTGCPVGFASAGILGAMFSFIAVYIGKIKIFFKKLL
ncbi:hypothetical protein [Desulfothermus sp.]